MLVSVHLRKWDSFSLYRLVCWAKLLTSQPAQRFWVDHLVLSVGRLAPGVLVWMGLVQVGRPATGYTGISVVPGSSGVGPVLESVVMGLGPQPVWTDQNSESPGPIRHWGPLGWAQHLGP